HAPLRHDDCTTRGDALLDVASASAHELIHPTTERDHRNDRERREEKPLRPFGHAETREAEHTHDSRGDTEKDKVELRVNDEHLDAKESETQNEPSPPGHRSAPSARARF